MALTYDQVTAISEKYFLPKLYDNIFDSNPLLKRMKSKSYKKVPGGERIMVPLNYAQMTSAGWYAGSETLDTSDNQNISAAQYLWKQLYVNITILRNEELRNSGDTQVVDLVKSKMQIAQKTMADLLGTGLYSDGTDSDAIQGLRDIVATDQTVGGISQTDNSWWRGQVDSTTTTLSMAAVQSQFTAATVDNETPSVIVSTRSNYDRYYALLQPQQRFMDNETAKGGFTSLMFNMAPWIPDSHCPASHIFGINEGNIFLFAHTDEDMRMSPFVTPPNQNLKTAKLLWFGALGSSNNRLHFKLSAIAA